MEANAGKLICVWKDLCISIYKLFVHPSVAKLREGTFFIGGGGGGVGVGKSILEYFRKKSRGNPPSWNELMYDPSEILKQTHLPSLLPPPPPQLSKTKITESANNKLEAQQ